MEQLWFVCILYNAFKVFFLNLQLKHIFVVYNLSQKLAHFDCQKCECHTVSVASAGLQIWTSTRYASRCYRHHRLSTTGRYFPTMHRKRAMCCWLASFVGDCRNTACCVSPCTQATWSPLASRGTGGCGESSSLLSDLLPKARYVSISPTIRQALDVRCDSIGSELKSWRLAGSVFCSEALTETNNEKELNWSPKMFRVLLLRGTEFCWQ